MTELSERIAKLSPEQRALLERRLAGSATTQTATDREPIAIVGAACRFPGEANDLGSFWRLLREGKDGVGPVPPERWDADALFDSDSNAPGKISSRWGGFVSNVEAFDADFFGISPREAIEMDPQQRVLLEVAFDALENAAMPLESLAGGKLGVFVGVHGHASDYLLLQNKNLDELDGFSGTGAAHNLLAGRLSYILDTHGPALVVDTACSSSLVAVHLAIQSLRLNECSSALVGGVNLILTPNFTVAASRMQMLAPDGRCKAFDARADGFVRSEGVGVVVLKRLSDAIANQDSILAVIKGSAVNQDGHTNGMTAPNGLAQIQVIERALADASVPGESIEFVEAHGTGTALGDPIEMEALAATIGKSVQASNPCYVGSVKTNIGHLEGAAGVAGLIKAALVLQHGEIPPNLHFASLNPHIRIDGTRLKVPTKVETWRRASRRASVSSFGWSGTNAHVILEEAPTPKPTGAELSKSEPGMNVLAMSARSPDGLVEVARQFSAVLGSDSAISVGNICATAATRRTHHPYRLTVVGRTGSEIASEIDALLVDGIRRRRSAGTPRIAFVFPGHGAQWPGMGLSLFAKEPAFRRAVERCDAAIKVEAGWSLIEEIHADAMRSRLDAVDVAQPALFAFGVALAELWKSWGVTPSAVIGHSMGEVAAAHVAGALSLTDATRIICRRSRLLQSTERGGMMLLELSTDEAQKIADKFVGRLVIGAINGPRSTVLAGDQDALQEVATVLKAQDIYCRIVKGSPAGHSHLVEPLTPTLLREIANVRPNASDIAIYSTVTARVERGECFNPEYWTRNLREPVRFFDATSALLNDSFDVLVEVSPHPILSASIEDIIVARSAADDGSENNSGRSIALASLRRDQDDHNVLYRTLGQLYERGAAIKWHEIFGKSERPVDLPRYPWQRRRYWLTRTQPRPGQSVMGEVNNERAQADQNGKVANWLYSATWLETLRTDPRQPEGCCWLLLAAKDAASGAFAATLERQLRNSGHDAVLIASDGDAASALNSARTDGRVWSGIVHCAALDAMPVSAVTAATLAADPIPGSTSLLAAIRSLDADLWPGDPKLWILTRGASVVHDADRRTLALTQAPVRGLARVIEAEQPTRFAGCIDLDPNASLAQQAADLETELIGNSDETAISFRSGRRFVQRLVPLFPPGRDPSVTFRADSAYLITGGLGGIGLFVARWMIAQGARHLIIVGRTVVPPRKQWFGLEDGDASPAANRVSAIRELEQLGAAVHYFPVDVSDQQALTTILEDWRAAARPRIRGVVHTAAVIDDQLLADLKPGSIARVFGVKAVGAWLLGQLVNEADWQVLFSSLASIWPVPGHANYAAANAFLDGLSQYASGNGRHVLSVSWGLWDNIGFARTAGGQEAQRRFGEQGVGGFSADDGLQALETLLASQAAHAVVLNADRDQLARGHSQRPVQPLLRNISQQSDLSLSRLEATGSDQLAFTVRYRQTHPDQRTALMRRCVGRHLAEVLKLGDVELEPDRPLGEYGLNSIMGLELRHRLERELSLRLSATIIWNYPTLASLAAHLQTRLDPIEASENKPADRAASKEAPATSIGDVDARLRQMEELSDEAALKALRAAKVQGTR
jgi:acyl transferase domain-containing protein/acyl carrier protein